MPVRIGLITSAMLWAVPAFAQPAAQPTIKVGDGTITGAKLKPYSNAWMFSFKAPDGIVHDQGIWSDVMRWKDVDGKHLLERVQGMTYATGQSSVTINRFDPKTLAPVYSELHGPDGKILKRTFSGAHIETDFTSAPGAKVEHRSTDLPFAIYDFNGGMYGMLLAAQPLRVGYKGVLPAAKEFEDKPDLVPFEVVGKERIRAGFKGETDAWVVKVSGDNPMTFWLSDAPPYILRLVLPFQKGEADYDIIS